MKRLQDQHRLNWLTPNELFGHFLDVSRLTDGTTIREELQRIRDGEAFEDQVLSLTKQTPEDVILYKQKREEWDAARNSLMERYEEAFLRCGAEGGWLAFGRRSPFSEEELIPPHYWDFLTLDRGARNAKNERHGLEFSGLRCLILQDLPREWRLHVLAELDEIDAATREAGSRPSVGDDHGQPISPTRVGAGPPSEGTVTHDWPSTNDRKLPVYNQVALAFDKLSPEEKAKIYRRGGRTEVAKLVSEMLPDIKPASVERELRHLYADLGLTKTGRKPEA